MKHPFFRCSVLAALLILSRSNPLAAGEIQLRLNPAGQAKFAQLLLDGEAVKLGGTEVVIRRGGTLITVPKNCIECYTFLPGGRLTPPKMSAAAGTEKAVTVTSSPNAATLTKGPLGILDAADFGGIDPYKTPITDANLRAALSSPGARVLLQQIQESFMAAHKGDPHFGDALAAQNDLFARLLSGQMTLEQLRATAGKTAQEARAYNAKEQQEAGFPETPQLVDILQRFVQTN